MNQSYRRFSQVVRGNATGTPALNAINQRRQLQERLAQASAQNAANMIDYQQTQDGWLQGINNMMGRMSELAIMANDGTKTAADRSALQAEFSQMQQEIQRITTGPYAAGRFNGRYLFQG